MNEQGLFYRDTWAEVDLDGVSENVTAVKKLLPADVEIIAVVKANAYGHGDVRISETVLKAGATYLAVAFMDEAIALRNKGIAAPILVLGATRAADVRIAARLKITLTVFRLDWVKEATKVLGEDESLSVHIKLDTGMGRIGIREPEELKEMEMLLGQDSRFDFEGIFTHFATADEPDQTYFEQQYDLFEKMLSILSKMPKYVHCSNSAAALRHSKAYFNAVRLGIAMYGLAPSPEMEQEITIPLKEAFSLRSRLIHVKKLHKGEKVSYGATYEAEEEEWIGTLPIGYADGWIRKLQGQEVIVGGVRLPIVGRICMDQCMIRLPHQVSVGTVVTLIGEDNGSFISVNEIARKLETINYEIPCMIASRVPRLYRQGGEIVDMKNYLL